jgi:hypothetical protein
MVGGRTSAERMLFSYADRLVTAPAFFFLFFETCGNKFTHECSPISNRPSSVRSSCTRFWGVYHASRCNGLTGSLSIRFRIFNLPYRESQRCQVSSNVVAEMTVLGPRSLISFAVSLKTHKVALQVILGLASRAFRGRAMVPIP